jgi:PIN domain nuclease of toxin-antitoxin system
VKLLLDTQAFIWWREGHRKLGPRARSAIARDAASVRVSVASAWEIALKWRAGRLSLPAPPDRWLPTAIESSGFDVLPIVLDHALAVANLPDHHPDPFDRLLIAQAQIEGLTIMSADTAFDAYQVRVLDARA